MGDAAPVNAVRSMRSRSPNDRTTRSLALWRSPARDHGQRCRCATTVLEVAVDGPGGALAVAHGQDHRRGAADDVAAGEYAGLAGHAVAVDDDVAVLVDREVRRGRGEQGVGA